MKNIKGTTESFITKAKLKHGNKYYYSLAEYNGAKTKIKIICPIHGVFEQTPTNHLSGNGCPKCSGNIKYNTTEFIEKATLIHGDKYEYSLVEYKNNKTKIKIICPIHGVFEQSAINHLRGNSCPKCIGRNKTNEEFIKKAREIHGDKYDYSLIDKNKNIKIICLVHGIFEQRASHHLSGSGCPKCAGKNKTTEEFIRKAKEVHGDRYDYSKSIYLNDKSKILIICPIHGEFKQISGGHLQGSGCPICRESKGEREIRQFLIENKIKFIPQHRFKNCRDKNPLPFDFYLPENNVCIEFQGRQHYEPISIFGGENELSKLIKRDKIKMEYCINNNIPLILVKFDENVNKKLILGINPL
jgi:hypothetical protein